MKRLATTALCLVTIAACGGAKSPTAPTATTPVATAPAPTPTPAPTPSPQLNLSGTWTGTLRSAARPGESVAVKSWVATQNGASISGPVVIDIGGGTLVSATITGTVSGSQLSAASFTVAAGAIRELAACSFSGTGSQTATSSSISGTMAMTFAAPCVGADLVSPTSTDTWTFALTK